MVKCTKKSLRLKQQVKQHLNSKITMSFYVIFRVDTMADTFRALIAALWQTNGGNQVNLLG